MSFVGINSERAYEPARAEPMYLSYFAVVWLRLNRCALNRASGDLGLIGGLCNERAARLRLPGRLTAR